MDPDPHKNPPDDPALQNYQDDVDTSDDATDPALDEETDDPTEILSGDNKEFKEELDKYDVDEAGHGDDDMREEIEDRDEG